MAAYRTNNTGTQPSKRANLLISILFLWGLVVVLGFSFLWLVADPGDSYNRFYLLPWTLMTGIVVMAPSAYLLYKRKFDFFHPLVFAAWSYIFPAFVVGGVIISFEWVDPYFMAFIDDPAYTLPLSLTYVALGFLGLTVGFALPVGQYCANKLERRLPKWKWEPSRVWFGGIFLLFAGIGFNILGLIQGIMGYQKITEIGSFDGLLYFLLILLSEGSVLLWIAIFSARKKLGIYYIVLVLLIIFLPIRMALQGGRSGLVSSIFPIAMAFQYSGRRLKWQYTAVFGVLLTLAVIIGSIYGNTFRNIKGSEAQIEAGEYFRLVAASLDYLSTQDPAIVIRDSAQSLADRVENLSSLAVVVSNYERLAPYEASYGLENNILNDTLTSFVPRFVWNEKPPTSDARAYGDLYFNFGDNSFAITPFGDLLRNFGPIGIPIGMLLAGIYLRLIYVALIDTPSPAMWKKVAYFPLLTLVSYEGFYATIFPSILRTLVVLLISLLIVNFIVNPEVRRRLIGRA